jgi:DnaJ-class molecular chaperone
VGDQLVQVQVYVPTRLTAAEKQRLSELDMSENFQPQQDGHKSVFEKFKDALNL